MFKPTSLQLRGMPYDRASLMGTPHILLEQDDQRVCAICGKRATDKHHMSPKGRGNKFLTIGTEKLESALIDLCHGCHMLFHSPKLYAIEWQWDDDSIQEQWWSGELFNQNLKPHDPILFAFGRYVIYKDDEPFKVIRSIDNEAF